MASERVSRAIIDLVADPSGLKAGLAEGKKDVAGLGASVSALAKSISGDFTASSDAARKFGADVKTAITGAETSSRGLGAAVSKAIGADAIEKANAYARAVTAIGGASNLTAKEQTQINKIVEEGRARYKALGIDAPKALHDVAAATATVPEKASLAQKATDALKGSLTQLAAGFAIGNLISGAVTGLVSWTKEAFESAGATLDLSDKTGLSTDTIQKMQMAAKLTGAELGNFTDAAFKLGARISGGSGSVRQAFDDLRKSSGDLGVSWEQLRGMSPDQQFETIAGALGHVENAQERNRIALDLFGKGAGAILPAIVQGWDSVTAGANRASREQLEALDGLADEWDKFWENQKRDLQAWLGAQVVATRQLGQLRPDQQARYNDMTAGGFAAGSDAMDFLLKISKQKDIHLPTPNTGEIKSYVAALKEAETAVSKLSKSTVEEIFAAEKLGASQDDVVNRFGITEQMLAILKTSYADHKTALSQAQSEAQKLGEAQANVASATQDLTGKTRETVAWLLKQGASESDVALAMKVTSTQVKEVAKTEQFLIDVRKIADKQAQEYIATQRKAMDASAKGIVESVTAVQQLRDRLALQHADALDRRMLEIQQAEDAEIKAIENVGDVESGITAERKRLIHELYQYQRDEALGSSSTIIERMRQQGVLTRADLQSQADAATRDYQQMRAAGVFTYDELREAGRRSAEAQARASGTVRIDWIGAFEDIGHASADNLGRMLAGAESFGEGLVGIWKSIQSRLANIFGQIADSFIQGALKKILAASMGSSTGGVGTWSGIAKNALGIGGGLGAGAATSTVVGMGGEATVLGTAGTGAVLGTGGIAGTSGSLAGGSGAGFTAGAAGTALGVGAAAGGGIASGMLGKWLAGGAGWKAGGIGAAGGAATGALIGTAIFPGVGTGVGAGVGALAGLITGLVGRSKGGKEDDQANKDLTSARAGLVGQYGSVENIAALDRAVGTNLAAGWGEAGKKGALAFAAEAQRFETSVKAAQDAGVTLSDLMAIGQPEQSVEQRLTKIKGLIEDLGKTGGVASKDLLRLRDSLEGTDEVKAFKTQQSAGAASGIGDFLSSAKVTNQGTASAVGDTLQGSFATMVGQGMSAKDAFAALKPQVDAFNKQLADTGLTGGASFGTLASMAGIVGNEVSGKALTAISGLSGALAGAQNAGFLTQSMFTSLTAEMLTQREAILATGATREDVDALTQKDLQAIWVLQHDNNYEVDAGTQALLTQAEASGTVGDKYRSAMDRAAIAMEKVAASLDVVLGKTDGVGKAIDRIPSKKTITVDIDTRGVAGAFDGLERSGTDATDAVYDGVNAVSFGHSPGGIKEIPIQLGKASTAFDVFATDTARPLRDVKDSIDGAASRTSDLGSALGSMRVPPSFTAEVSTAVTGIGSLVGTTKTVVDDATSGVGVLRGSVQGLSTDTRTAGSTMEGAFAGAVIKGEAARSKVSEITTAVGTVAGALEAVPWQPWSELAIIQAGNAEGAVGKVTAGSVALEIALKRAPWPEWAGNAVSAVQAVTREFDILLGRIAAAATGILTLPTPSAGGSVPPGGSSPTPKPGPVIISKPGDTLPGPARPGPVPGPGTYPGTPGPVRTLLSATPFTLNRSTSAAPASLSSASSANSGKPMTLHAPVSIQVNGDVTDQNARILSDEVVRGLAQKLPRIINQGGTTLTAWRDLPLETP